MPVPTFLSDNFFKGAYSSLKLRVVVLPHQLRTLTQDNFARTYACLTGGVL